MTRRSLVPSFILLGSLALFACDRETRPPAAPSLAATAPSSAATLAIVGGTVVHPARDGSSAIERDATVLVRGDRIVACGPMGSTSVPDGARVLNARGKWIIPGLIDTHVHFFQSGNPFTRPDGLNLTAVVPYAQEVARNQARLPVTFAVWLASGVTSVADVGGPFWNFDVRDAARTHPAPRVFVAGPLLSMIADPALDLGDPPIIQVRTPDDARLLAAKELARKPDFLKVWFIHHAEDNLAQQEAIVRAAAETAHAAHVPLAVHATEREVATSALRAGANLLVHSVSDEPVDAAFLDLATKNHVVYTPTLFVMNGYALVFSGKWKATEAERRLADPVIIDALEHTTIPEGVLSPERKARLAARTDLDVPSKVSADNLRRVWNAGIPVALGTDAGNIGTVHGPSVFREMDFMAKAGLTPGQILRAATTNGAKFLAREADLGDVASGMFADLVVLDGDPLADAQNTSRAYRVIKGGEVYDPSELRPAAR